MRVHILDGPMGTELERRGVPLPPPLWTATAVLDRPETVTAIHRDYEAAGADVHTSATFRTTARALAGTAWADRWAGLAARAVELCRAGVGPDATIAGSIAPLEDCYRPDLTPADDELAAEHAALARVLADAGCDLLLVETMPTTRELAAATTAAADTGRPVWAAITLGPRGDFFDTAGVRHAMDVALEAGAEAFLINCTPPDVISAVLPELHAHRPEARLGAYGNNIFVGHTDWSPERYAAEGLRWTAAGARIVGGCCGTTPEHLRALATALGGTAPVPGA
jgi:S-methylmethionine-dependent homocysteine/selenocysteine methylase